MIEGKLSRRYAAAIFELARVAGTDEETGQELERFKAAYGVPPLAAGLTNPAFSIESRKRVVAQIAAQLKLSRLTLHLVSLLLDRDRLDYLESIALYYQRLQDAAHGCVQAKVTSPTPLAAAEVGRLAAALKGISGKEVVMGQQTDAGLLGGLVVEIEGKVYDGSLRTQLEKMKKQIEQGY